MLATAAYEIRRRRGKVTHRLWTGAALAPLGRLGYVLWVGHREGDLHGDRLVFPMALLLVAALLLQRGPAAAARAGAGEDGQSPALAPAAVAGALAGLSFAYGAYLVVIADTPL
ncbi:hypothetical protein [Streptomyces canus]|uniref:hypothetical protein n=1 Tax=Streptomyces canus TaxID=58343 RepID=UPI003F53F705